MNFWIQALLLSSVLGLIFVNGWTDAPSAIAGIVATGGMRYRSAAVMAAGCNLLGALLFCYFGGQVAQAIAQLTDFSSSGQKGVLAMAGCFLAVVVFAAIAWFWGIPTSESHGLMAGMLGSALALGQSGSVRWEDWKPVLAGLFLSLGMGLLLGFVLYRIFGKLLSRVNGKALDWLQCLGAAGSAFMHGSQDGQKFAAVLVTALMLCGGNGTRAINFKEHLPAVALCALVMGLGTLCGGKRIIQKTAMDLVKIDKSQSVVADFSSSLSLFILSLLGLPVSTTHTKTSAMAGCSAARSRQSVDLSVAGQMIFAWVITFPLCGLLSYLFTKLFLVLPF